MTNRKAYQCLLLEYKCFKYKTTCGHDCSICPYYSNPKSMDETFKFLMDVLKARDPMLYLANDIELIKEVLSNDQQL